MQCLSELVTEALTLCQANGYKSISFPAIGAGRKNYPVDVVAQTLCEAVLQHLTVHTDSCLESIVFVIDECAPNIYKV